MKYKIPFLRTLYSFLILSLLLSVLSPLFLHHHHIHSLCADPEIGHSEEFCPICWFILQLNTSVLLVIAFVFVFVIKIGGQTQKSPFHFSYVSLYLSRAPPLTI